ncbi:MAG: kynurenine 3-monooxygenase, partial [Flavobacteriaceae bacterium]
VANPIFQEKRKLEMAFEKNFPDDYSSKYSLVTFNEDIGYREAMLRGRAQDKAILNLLSDGEIELPLPDQKVGLRPILEKVIKETEAILEDDRVAGLK